MSDLDAAVTGHTRRGFLLVAATGLVAAATAPLLAHGALAAPPGNTSPIRYEVVETGPGTYYLKPVR